MIHPKWRLAAPLALLGLGLSWVGCNAIVGYQDPYVALDGSLPDGGSGTDHLVPPADHSAGDAVTDTRTDTSVDAPADAIVDVGIDAPGNFDVEPSTLQTLPVVMGVQQPPTLTFTATVNGQPAPQTIWRVDRPALASIAAGPASSALFAPSATAGGMVTVSATLDGATLTRQVLIQLSCGTLNGATPSEQTQVASSVAELTAGGGIGGVGGEGLGPAATFPTTTMPASAEGLSFLYPYDQTVFPLGMSAPLLQWTWTPGDSDAIQIQLSTQSGSFSCSATYGRPTILAQVSGSKFLRHPIPQDVWSAATASSTGKADPLTVKLTVARSGIAYGPISETWFVAPQTLSSVLYYTGYGQLALNYAGAIGGNMWMGGYVAGVPQGSTSPVLVAGTSSMMETGCRACHSAAMNGSALTAQHGESYVTTSAYALSPGMSTETVLTHPLPNDESPPPAVYPDGTFILNSAGQLLPIPIDTAPFASSGLTSSELGVPSFSHDGAKVVFNPGGTTMNFNTLYVVPYDNATHTFGSATPIWSESADAGAQPSWPAFLPGGGAVVWNEQSAVGTSDPFQGMTETRKGAKAQIYVTSASAATGIPLAHLNGTGYLPIGSGLPAVSCEADGTMVGTINPQHDDDVDMNYEPAVAPVAAGGYAWVVFVSRRMYGTEITIPPYCSDPRGVNLVTNISPKKIWIAAVDLDAPPGTDGSHPAFYFPGQELLGSNGRPQVAFPPCLADGAACGAGTDCCGGYCSAGTCSSTSASGCSKLAERCATASDCCDATNICLDGACAFAGPQ